MTTFAANLVDGVQRALANNGAFETVTYNSKPAPSINYETGAVTQAPTSVSVDMLFGAYRNDEVDGAQILSSDRWGVVPKADLAEAGVSTPTARDTITIGGVEEEIVSVGETASGATWRFQLRKVGTV